MTSIPETPPSTLEVRLFGGFEARVQGRPMPSLRSRREQWLLALLVLRHDRDTSRDWLASALWPDNEEEQALFYLRKALSNLRRALGGEAVRLQSPSPRTLRLDVAGAFVDVVDFDAAAKLDNPAETLAEAVGLHRGALLPDCQEEWAILERGPREQAYLSVLEQLARLSDPPSAARWLRLLTEADPYRERAYRDLMSALADCGDRAALKLVYRGLQKRLYDDLNSLPSPETDALYQELLHRKPQPAASLASPPSSVDPRRHLPVPLTDLVGRVEEIARVLGWMKDRRLVSLVGPGGVGKTRLSIGIADAAIGGFEHGVWFVDLAPLTDSAMVPRAVARTLRIPEEQRRPVAETLCDALRARKVLLVLDNCEHLIEACAGFTQNLLAECPMVSIIATSRQALHVTGEQVFPVPSLRMPEEVFTRDPQSLLEFEAAQLFVDCATRVTGDFHLNTKNASSVAEICRRLDGIPLAIELAAARLRSLSVRELCERLDQRFKLLTGGSRAALPRQQTLKSLIDWSYDLLNEEEKALLCRLSVFAGGWSLAAAEQVCSGEPVERSEALDLLTSLVDKSLVTTQISGIETRYRQLETIRQYSWDRLVEAGEADRWRNRHLAYFLALAEEARPHLAGSEDKIWMDRLEAELDNVRSAFAWALDGTDAPEPSLRLCHALYNFWVARAYEEEGRTSCAAALERSKDCEKSSTYAQALRSAGGLAMNIGDYDLASAQITEGLNIFREVKDDLSAASCLNVLGLVAMEQGRFESAMASYSESLSIRRKHEEPMGISQVLVNMGQTAVMQGLYDAARPLLEESLSIRRGMNWKRGWSMPLEYLGEIAFEQGDFATARQLFEESLSLRREIGDRSRIAASLCSLGRVALELGDHQAAQSLQKESLVIRKDLRLRPSIPESLDSFADLAAVLAERSRAARLWGAAEGLREGMKLHEPYGAKVRRLKRIDSVRASGDDEASFQTAWQEGREMSMERAIECALADSEATGRIESKPGAAGL